MRRACADEADLLGEEVCRRPAEEASEMATLPPKPWEVARGGAVPSSVDVTQAAQQAAATQQNMTPVDNGPASRALADPTVDNGELSTSYGGGLGTR